MDYIERDIAGRHIGLRSDSDSYYMTIDGQNVSAGGTPYVVKLDPALGPVNEVNFGDVYQFVVTRLVG